MFCEVEFLAVGEASSAGDAIIVKYGNLNDYKLMVVDGGTTKTGETLVEHLKSHFGQSVILEDVVLTHSDNDHASGLREVLNEIPVKNLWVHIPWLLSAEAIQLFKNPNWTETGLNNSIKAEYSIISELLDIAIEKGIDVYYPFQGSQIGPFTVLSPTRYSYIHLLPQFEKTPEANQELLESVNFWIGKEDSSLISQLMKLLQEQAQKWTDESWNNERLKDGGVTSASNESSVVMYADIGEGRRYLLTGDAGVNALLWAAEYAESRGFILQNFSFVQVPHHGSRRNVGPTILNRLIGPIQPVNSPKRFSCFVSAPKDDSKHPRKIVLNAFTRRGGNVKVTAGTNWLHYGGFPPRSGYNSTIDLPLYASVEDYD